MAAGPAAPSIARVRALTGLSCFVRSGGDEPRANVPRTAVEQGHALLAQRDEPDGTTLVLLRKKAARAP